MIHKVDKRDWRIWLGFFLGLLFIIITASKFGPFVDSLPTVTVRPRQMLEFVRLAGILIAPIAGLITIYMFLSSPSPTQERNASVIGQLDDIPTEDELADLLAKHLDGEHPLETAEVLVSFIIPPEILEDMDRVYRENYDQVIETANMQRPKPSDNVEFHHPLPLAFEIGSIVTGLLREEIEEEVEGDVLKGVARYITSYYFGIRAMQDARISIDQSK